MSAPVRPLAGGLVSVISRSRLPPTSPRRVPRSRPSPTPRPRDGPAERRTHSPAIPKETNRPSVSVEERRPGPRDLEHLDESAIGDDDAASAVAAQGANGNIRTQADRRTCKAVYHQPGALHAIVEQHAQPGCIDRHRTTDVERPCDVLPGVHRHRKRRLPPSRVDGDMAGVCNQSARPRSVEPAVPDQSPRRDGEHLQACSLFAIHLPASDERISSVRRDTRELDPWHGRERVFLRAETHHGPGRRTSRQV
jgi:hypothetical protein